MTVTELIARLQRYPPDCLVYVPYSEEGRTGIATIVGRMPHVNLPPGIAIPPDVAILAQGMEHWKEAR